MGSSVLVKVMEPQAQLPRRVEGSSTWKRESGVTVLIGSVDMASEWFTTCGRAFDASDVKGIVSLIVEDRVRAGWWPCPKPGGAGRCHVYGMLYITRGISSIHGPKSLAAMATYTLGAAIELHFQKENRRVPYMFSSVYG